MIRAEASQGQRGDAVTTAAHEMHGTVDLHTSLLEALSLEPKYQPTLTLPYTTKDCSEISMRMRNGSAHVLRCLKVWYDLSPDTFFNAINIMDRFLTRMRAQPKHLSCIAVSAFHLSCEYTPGYGSETISQVVPDPQDLTTISQSKCSPGDVARMKRIIKEKIDTNVRCQAPITPLTMLRLLYAAHAHLATHCTGSPVPLPKLTSLTHKLEIIACDTAATTYRPAELSLALLTLEAQGDLVNFPVHKACLDYLYNICKIETKRFDECRKVVSELMDQYENQRYSPHRQRLIWRLSNRTMRQLRPTYKFTVCLPTIDERQMPPHPVIRPRIGKEPDTVSSEEDMEYDYDEEFPPLPQPAKLQRSPLKSAPQSHKKQPASFPYPRTSRKHGRSV